MWMPLKAERDRLEAANTHEFGLDPNKWELYVYCWGSKETIRGEKAKEMFEMQGWEKL